MRMRITPRHWRVNDRFQALDSYYCKSTHRFKFQYDFPLVSSSLVFRFSAERTHYIERILEARTNVWKLFRGK